MDATPGSRRLAAGCQGVVVTLAFKRSSTQAPANWPLSWQVWRERMGVDTQGVTATVEGNRSGSRRRLARTLEHADRALDRVRGYFDTLACGLAAEACTEVRDVI